MRTRFQFFRPLDHSCRSWCPTHTLARSFVVTCRHKTLRLGKHGYSYCSDPIVRVVRTRDGHVSKTPFFLCVCLRVHTRTHGFSLYSFTRVLARVYAHVHPWVITDPCTFDGSSVVNNPPGGLPVTDRWGQEGMKV